MVKKIIKEDSDIMLIKPNDKNNLLNIINSNLNNLKFTKINDLNYTAEKCSFVKYIENVGDLYQDILTKNFIFKTVGNVAYILS